ncbi:DUF6538 domain-containing protein [Parasphingorhabdus sp. NYA22]
MRKQTYLIRKGARYHFRRRFESKLSKRPISITLGTADPGEARRLASRLAVIWDKTEMDMQSNFQRGTLTIEEREAIFKNALKEELGHATAHKDSPIGSSSTPPFLHKIMAAAYRIVQQVPHDAKGIDAEIIESVIGDNWSDSDFLRLIKTLEIAVTPMSVSLSDAKDALDELGISHNQAILGDARYQKFRGYAEAHDRAALLDHSVIKTSGRGVMALLDDDIISRALQQLSENKTIDLSLGQAAASIGPEIGRGNQYLNPSSLKFSEIIEPTLKALFIQKNWKPDRGQRNAIAERFAWVTGDKSLSDYNQQDIRDFVEIMHLIPKDFRFGHLGKSGPMAKAFDLENIPKIEEGMERNDRTINRDLSVLQNISKYLSKTHWRSQYKDIEMNFVEEGSTIELDPDDPDRMPWTPAHLKAMFNLPLWQGGGGAHNRVKENHSPVIYQDAAYWAPLIGTYSGLAREEVCGLEVVDFGFDCEIPFLMVQSNMTRSQDGKTPGGLKRKSRRRVMPLHPQLLRLGLKAYVEAISAEHESKNSKILPIFPELYEDEAKITKNGKVPSTFGGKRFYAIAWCFLADATHAVLPLPETNSGKHSDFHSLRTYNQSVLASPEISQTIIDKHMGHSLKGTGPRSYNKRAAALGETTELKERLQIMISEMPNVTAHVKLVPKLRLLPINNRSRVGSAKGRSAKHRFCQ